MASALVGVQRDRCSACGERRCRPGKERTCARCRKRRQRSRHRASLLATESRRPLLRRPDSLDLPESYDEISALMSSFADDDGAGGICLRPMVAGGELVA